MARRTRSDWPEGIETNGVPWAEGFARHFRGHFYALVPDGEQMPHRVKFGFSNQIKPRFWNYLGQWPKARLYAVWPCLSRWEHLLIAWVTAEVPSVRVPRMREQFDVSDLTAMKAALDGFVAAHPVYDLPKPDPHGYAAQIAPWLPRRMSEISRAGIGLTD